MSSNLDIFYFYIFLTIFYLYYLVKNVLKFNNLNKNAEEVKIKLLPHFF